MERREFVKALGASLVVFQHPVLAGATASLPELSHQPSPKVVWVMLRGAMDSLHTLVPKFDSELAIHRPKLTASLQDKLLDLDGNYALHPSLKNLHAWYQSHQLLPIVAVSSGYQARSHFDGQDFLESGHIEIEHDSGWLGRAAHAKRFQSIAISRSTPISLRGNDNTTSWYPSGLRAADSDIYQTLKGMYESEPMLACMLEEGIATQEMASSSQGKRKQKGKFTDLAQSCGKLLKGQQGVDCAMLELSGWDTHNNQVNRQARALSELDKGLGILKTTLADDWENTVVVVATEFGRTVKENGTGGTDHGTASMLMLAGGCVNGGKVLGQWPGLKESQLHQGRDLRATSNVYSWIANVLEQHWQLSSPQLDDVFPLRQPIEDSLLKTV